MSTSSHNFSDNLSVLSYKEKRCIPAWVYDRKRGEFFGRTGKSWFLILLFYVIYYALLAGFFVGMLTVFLTFIVPKSEPMRTGQQSLLKFTPGLGMRPNMDVAKTLIKYSHRDPQTYVAIVQNLDAFMNSYYDLASKDPDQLATCTNGKKEPNEIDKVCKFETKELGPCTQENQYGYNGLKPCVFLKINKIFGWLPDPEDEAQPSPMVVCKGQHAKDVESLGELSYYPSMTLNGTVGGKIDTAYYPFVGQTGYVSPLVAVHLKNLKPNTLVQVRCQLLNLKSASGDEVSETNFEILAD